MKNWTDYDTFLMHLECTIENVGINAIQHQDQEKVHKEALKAVEFICATIERQRGREEKTIKTGKQHEPTNEAQTKPCNIYGVSGMLPDCKHEHIDSADGCDECLDCGAKNF